MGFDQRGPDEAQDAARFARPALAPPSPQSAPSGGGGAPPARTQKKSLRDIARETFARYNIDGRSALESQQQNTKGATHVDND